MATLNVNTEALSGATAQSIDDMLADLDLDTALNAGSDAVEEVVEGETEIEAAGDVVEELPEAEAAAEVEASDELEITDLDIGDLDMALAREESYESQESELNTVEDAEGALEEAKASSGKPAKRAAGTKKAATGTGSPRVTAALTDLAPETFVLVGDASTMSAADLDANKAYVIGTKPAIKKIGEKFDNLFGALAVNKQPSVYVMQAFKLLEQKGEFTSTELVTFYKGSYSQGTAQSQAGQIMKLFDVVGIANRSGNKLVANKDSVVAAKIRKILADAAAAKSGS